VSVCCHERGQVPNTCPTLFQPTDALDGKLVRIRIPGGILTSEQGRVLADTSDRLGSSAIEVTNRANIQLRGVKGSIPPEILFQLQEVGLAGKMLLVDGVRNIMASPTAGIDPEQLIDTRFIVKQLAQRIGSNFKFAELSPKFSIGIDGGEKVSIWQQPNDILLQAVKKQEDRERVWFHLYLAGIDARVACLPEDCIAVVEAIAEVYLDLVDANITRKPRLKQVLQQIGLDNYLDRIKKYFPNLSDSNYTRPTTDTCDRLGIHHQLQPHLYYMGIALPLGRLTTDRLRQICDIAKKYGNGSVRLTPWRSILLPDIQDTSSVEQQLEELGLSSATNTIWEGSIACSGTSGCAASVTDTQSDAFALAEYISNNLTLDKPLTIHLTGCPKSCAHHGSSDLTLVGVQIDKGDRQIAGYHLYGGNQEPPFGKLLLSNLEPNRLPEKIAQILAIYQREGEKKGLSWQEFINCWFDTEGNSC
jgi:ferredoxin-nitrite reductase